MQRRAPKTPRSNAARRIALLGAGAALWFAAILLPLLSTTDGHPEASPRWLLLIAALPLVVLGAAVAGEDGLARRFLFPTSLAAPLLLDGRLTAPGVHGLGSFALVAALLVLYGALAAGGRTPRGAHRAVALFAALLALGGLALAWLTLFDPSLVWTPTGAREEALGARPWGRALSAVVALLLWTGLAGLATRLLSRRDTGEVDR